MTNYGLTRAKASVERTAEAMEAVHGGGDLGGLPGGEVHPALSSSQTRVRLLQPCAWGRGSLSDVQRPGRPAQMAGGPVPGNRRSHWQL